MAIVDPFIKESSSSNEYVSNYLDFLGKSEGADYDTLVGNTKFSDFSKHPGIVGVTTKEGPSTAAGKYQIVGKTYEQYAKKLGITDFTPASQDKIALELIKDKGALPDVEKGDWKAANEKLGGVWASLPTSKYSQPKRSEDWATQALIIDPISKKEEPTKIVDPFETQTSKPTEIVDPFASQTKSTTDTGMLGAFGKAAASSAATAIGAAPFMATGAEVGAEIGLPLGPAGVIGGSIVGGLAGMVGGAKLMNAIGDTIPENIKGIFGFDKATREAERQAHPEASFAGDLSGNLVLFRPGSLEPIITKGGSVITPIMQRTGMGVFGGGLEAGQEYMNEGKIDPMHVGEAAAFTAWAAKPTPYMEKMGGLFKSREPLFDTSEKHWGADGEWIPPATTADGIPIRLGPTGKSRPDGTYVPATHIRNPDGTSSHIQIDIDHIKSQFNDKPWTSPKVEGVDPLPETSFKS